MKYFNIPLKITILAKFTPKINTTSSIINQYQIQSDICMHNYHTIHDINNNFSKKSRWANETNHSAWEEIIFQKQKNQYNNHEIETERNKQYRICEMKYIHAM